MHAVRMGQWLFHLFLGVALLGAVLYARPASAGLVGTEEIAGAAQAAEARARLQFLAERPEVAKQLQTLGIAPHEAADRVAAMSDAEVVSISGKVGALPAGGAMTNTELLIVILLVVLVALAL